jgi:hypothetical protein
MTFELWAHSCVECIPSSSQFQKNGVLGNYDPMQSEVAENATLQELPSVRRR